MDTDELNNKEYLGDGLYIGHDGYQIWLYTLEGNAVALEPSVMQALINYNNRINSK